MEVTWMLRYQMREMRIMAAIFKTAILKFVREFVMESESCDISF